MGKLNRLNVVSNNFSNLYNEGVVVVCQPPARRIINLDLYYDDEGMSLNETFQGSFFLSFPSIHFRFHYRRLKDKCFRCVGLHVVAVGDDKKNKAFVLPIPNVFKGGLVCIDFKKIKYLSLADLCRDVIKNFWSSEFNSEFSNISMYSNSLLGDYKKWQAKTKKQPNWIPTTRSLKSDVMFDKGFFFGDFYVRDIIPSIRSNDDDDDDDDDL